MANKTNTDDWYKKYMAANDKAQSYVDQIADREPFKFDVNSDPLYEQLKDQYTQQGRLAMMDTVGNVSALTGGYGNSYAQTAGQQAFNQYMGQLNSAIPGLYESAYTKWQNEGNDLYNKYQLYATEKESAKADLDAAKTDLLTQIAGGYQASDKQLSAVGLDREKANAHLNASATGKDNTSNVFKDLTIAQIEKEAAKFKADGDNDGLNDYLTYLEKNGVISETTSDYLYKAYVTNI